MKAQNRKNTFSKMRIAILKKRYLWKDKRGKLVETEGQMYRRVAGAIAAIESAYGATKTQTKAHADKFYRMMRDGKFLPNSPTLMSGGRVGGMLSACFVLPILDSLKEILKTVVNTGLIQKAGGGTGISFDRLRPTGDLVTSSGGRTSGPMSFGGILAETTRAIQQGAHRRGANMGMMSVEHPDILRFIHAKEDLGALNNFNLSVKIPTAWMKKLQSDPNAVHVTVNPRTRKEYVIPHSADAISYTIDDLLPEKKATDDCYTVKEVWDMIVKNAHATGEPGICFIDHINDGNPTPHIGRIEATNPCGEQPLLPYEACNLGSINVAKLVDREGADLDWDSLADTTRLAVRFLDNVIDANHFPIPEIRKVTLGNRKIGLGIMGFADALVLLGIKYDSGRAVEFAGKLASAIQECAHKASEDLANERGCFPNWKGSTWDTKYHRPMRNAACTTIAPTGSISIIGGGCSGGVEPIFSIIYEREALDGQKFWQLNPLVEKLGTDGHWLTASVRDQLAQGIPPREIPEIPRELAEVLVTAHEIASEWHVKIQAAFQKYMDNAVSKTVNLPADATVGDVDKVYRLAFERQCKGITVYRDGCRENQTIVAARRNTELAAPGLDVRPRVRTTEGSTSKFRMGCGTLFVTVNNDEQGLCEVFANLGKAGGCPAQSEATCRAVSVALRCGVKPGVLIEQLKGIRCLSAISRKKGNSDVDVLSCPDAIGRALEQIVGPNPKPTIVSLVGKCPDCGHPMRRDSRCKICDNCGFDKCG